MDEVETRLCAARTRLILDRPFLGALVLRLPLTAADPRWCPNIATDARRLYYNPEYIRGLSLEHTQFMLAHEALHCALLHFVRRQHRVRARWDLACDHAINSLLVHERFALPPGSLYDESFAGMTAEEIYPYIEENSAERPLDRHLYDQEDRGQGQSPPEGAGGEGHSAPPPESAGEPGARPRPQPAGEAAGAQQPRVPSGAEQESLAVQWQQRLAGAAQQAMQAGKLGAAMARLVDYMLQPQLPWRMLLARYMSASARDDYSYTRPSTRREGAAIMPSLRSTQIDVVVAVDVSGSVSEQEMNEFLAEVNVLKGQLRARLTLLACDAELAANGPWIYEPWEEVRLPEKLRGGGGTRFTPVFDWVERWGQRPDLLVYFTDGHGEFPRVEPSYPVIWLVKGRAPVPWGQRIQLN
jgi:predicted metal-dependent peptidase